ncbi:MAG: hypothetical protein ACI8W7_000277 [Gammaproteobacteria bacterium]|jgi:hypothetical protein
MHAGRRFLHQSQRSYTQDMRDDYLRGTRRVQLHRIGIPTELIQATEQLVLRRVKSTGTNAAVATTKDRLFSVLANHVAHCIGRNVQRFVPRYRNEGLDAASRCITASLFTQVAMSDQLRAFSDTKDESCFRNTL